jgi:hypothetical protein
MRRPARVKNYLVGVSTVLIADQREALGSLFWRPSLTAPTADSPCFHSHSLWSYLLRCQLVFSISNGCCHLSVELNASPGEASFRRDFAVTRTRRLATKLLILLGGFFPGLAVSQRLVGLCAHPQPMQ